MPPVIPKPLHVLPYHLFIRILWHNYCHHLHEKVNAHRVDITEFMVIGMVGSSNIIWCASQSHYKLFPNLSPSHPLVVLQELPKPSDCTSRGKSLWSTGIECKVQALELSAVVTSPYKYDPHTVTETSWSQTRKNKPDKFCRTIYNTLPL